LQIILGKVRSFTSPGRGPSTGSDHCSRRIHHEPHPYWATSQEAAVELGVSYSNVPLMMMAGRLPYETAANGRRYLRRHQLEVIANARETRLLEEAVGREAAVKARILVC